MYSSSNEQYDRDRQSLQVVQQQSGAEPSTSKAYQGLATSENEDIGYIERLATILSIIVVVLTFPISILYCFKVVTEYQRAVIFRMGRLKAGGARGPGIFFILPCIDEYCQVDLRTMTLDVPPQEVLSKDSVTVSVDAVVFYRISDPLKAVIQVANYSYATKLLAATTLRNVLGTRSLTDLLTKRELIAQTMQLSLDEATDPWGVKVERVEITDVSLPILLQRAMATEAEAAREARAKVVAAEGELKASQALKEASDIISESPAALQLRYLQTLAGISSEKNSTIIFPLPMELIRSFISAENETSGTIENLAMILAIAAVIITFPISIFFCFRIVAEYERAVIFRLGRLRPGGARGPGVIFVLPCVDNYCKVDMRTVSFDVPSQEVLSKDSVTVSVNAVVYYRISDPLKAIIQVAYYGYATSLLAATTLRNVLGTRSLSEMLTKREIIANTMQLSLDEATDPWGVKVERVEIKDVSLPTALQRAMAHEAETARVAKAKVIAAEGELKASHALKEASDIISENPAALQLRYLQTLAGISASKNTTIIFPLPMDFLSPFLAGGNK